MTAPAQQIRDFALRVVCNPDLEQKLQPPTGELVDDERALEEPVPSRPGRAPNHEIVSADHVRVPSSPGMCDPVQKLRMLHAFANHELQAAELFAWALLKWPEAPSSFRRGLLSILIDEQNHTRLYLHRLQDLGGHFGDYPVSGYFWGKSEALTTPAQFCCAMGLTFEQANLDHALEYGAAARQYHDEKTAKIFDTIHNDEKQHVNFGYYWLNQFKDEDQSSWDAYVENLPLPLRPARGMGRSFCEEGRRDAGLDEHFIEKLRSISERRDSRGFVPEDNV